MCTKELKSTKAITLIALVISILVLLILAGVSIGLLVGENGITVRAVTAKKTYNIAGAKEQVELLVEGYIGDYYGKKYTSGEAVSQDIGTYVATQLANDTTVGDYTLETSGANVTLKKGEETVAKGKINSSGGLEWSNGTETKIALLKVSDESSAKDATVGEEVKIGDEHFYVIQSDENMLTLLAKYNLAITPNETTGKYVQLNANYGDTACAFASEIYWNDDWENYYGDSSDGWNPSPKEEASMENDWEGSVWIKEKLNLNNKPIPTTGTIAQTSSNNAILRAKEYGDGLGGTGRLLTYEEANTIKSTMSTIIYGRYTGEDKVGGASGDGYLYSWLASVGEGSDWRVWFVYGLSDRLDDFDGYDIDCYYGVRPVLEISKDKIE